MKTVKPKPKLRVTYSMWAPVGLPPFKATIKGQPVTFKRLAEARIAASAAGYSGIRITGDE